MTKEELRKEAEEYLHENYCCKGSYCGFNAECKEGIRVRCSEFEILEKHIISFAQPREKQIQIDAEQIRALQKQNGELTDELTKKSDTNHQLVEQLAKLNERCSELEAQVEKMKCCLFCAYRSIDWNFSSICIQKDNAKIENPYTCKCDKWEIKENDN